MRDAAELTLELPIAGMDCAECTRSVHKALTAIPGVHSADVLLAAEKAVIRLDPRTVDRSSLENAVRGAGYRVPEQIAAGEAKTNTSEERHFTRATLGLLAVVVGAVLFIVVAGEWWGCSRDSTTAVPFPVGVAIVLAFGYPVFRNVIGPRMRRQVISHTVMTIGVLAALAIGQWATAAVVVFFMRIGDYAEHSPPSGDGGRSRI